MAHPAATNQECPLTEMAMITKLILKIFPEARTWKRRMHFAIQERSVRSRFLTSLYFALVDHSLDREAAALAAGRVRYNRDTDSEARSYFLLRRNIHRLEKGLTMRPRKSKFALDYIGETLSVFKKLYNSNHGDRPEGRWAKDVLTTYFRSVDLNDEEIARQYSIFRNTVGDIDTIEATSIPYPRGTQEIPVEYEKLVALAKRRRSVRWFLPDPPPRELIDKALSAAVEAPSACNRQPFVYRIFDKPEDARKIANMALGTAGFVHNIPALAVLVGRLRAYPEARDRHAIYIDASLSAMSFMFALETLGLASCPINWGDTEPGETLIADALGLERDERVIMLVAVGWPDPDGLIPFSAKRPLDEIRQFEDLG